MYEQFTEEQIVGSKSIWDAISKRKLLTFANKKVVTVKIQNQLINIKAERKLMSRFTVNERMKPDVDLPGYLRKCDLPVFSKSIFTKDGGLIPSKDDCKIPFEMLESLPVGNIAEESGDSDYRVIVFDEITVEIRYI